MVALDPKIWGPHYWFFLHTITMCYPLHPNAVTKKKYYEFIQNIPIFLPVDTIANDFSHLIDKYPVSPYLDSRDSLVKWVHFIHNKINEKLEKPKMTLEDFYKTYYDSYSKGTMQHMQKYKAFVEKLIYACILGLLVFLILYFYDK